MAGSLTETGEVLFDQGQEQERDESANETGSDVMKEQTADSSNSSAGGGSRYHLLPPRDSEDGNGNGDQTGKSVGTFSVKGRPSSVRDSLATAGSSGSGYPQEIDTDQQEAENDDYGSHNTADHTDEQDSRRCVSGKPMYYGIEGGGQSEGRERDQEQEGSGWPSCLSQGRLPSGLWGCFGGDEGSRSP